MFGEFTTIRILSSAESFRCLFFSFCWLLTKIVMVDILWVCFLCTWYWIPKYSSSVDGKLNKSLDNIKKSSVGYYVFHVNSSKLNIFSECLNFRVGDRHLNHAFRFAEPSGVVRVWVFFSPAKHAGEIWTMCRRDSSERTRIESETLRKAESETRKRETVEMKYQAWNWKCVLQRKWIIAYEICVGRQNGAMILITTTIRRIWIVHTTMCGVHKYFFVHCSLHFALNSDIQRFSYRYANFN